MSEAPVGAVAQPPVYANIEGPSTLDLCRQTFLYKRWAIPGAVVAAALDRLVKEQDFPLRPEYREGARGDGVA